MSPESTKTTASATVPSKVAATDGFSGADVRSIGLLTVGSFRRSGRANSVCGRCGLTTMSGKRTSCAASAFYRLQSTHSVAHVMPAMGFEMVA